VAGLPVHVNTTDPCRTFVPNPVWHGLRCVTGFLPRLVSRFSPQKRESGPPILCKRAVFGRSAHGPSRAMKNGPPRMQQAVIIHSESH